MSRSATLPWRMLDAFDANNIEPNLSFIGLCDGPFGEPVLLTGIAVTSGGISISSSGCAFSSLAPVHFGFASAPDLEFVWIN